MKFGYAMFLANKLYDLEVLPDDFEEIGLVAWEMIGNKRQRLYRYCTDINCSSNTVELPCNCDEIEAITYGFLIFILMVIPTLHGLKIIQNLERLLKIHTI